jgi:hypothetical protein
MGGWNELMNSIKSNMDMRRYELVITAGDLDGLRKQGLSDGEIFDIASAAAVGCFFSKTLVALGVLPDSADNDIDADLRQSLAVGRSIEDQVM